MNTPHTPAPWHVSRHATPDYAPQFGIYAEDGNGRDLAIVTSNEANANLIAAAPAMLAALEEIAAENEDDVSDRDELIRCAKIARTAIAIAIAKGTL